jgi:hypothetical protein
MLHPWSRVPVPGGRDRGRLRRGFARHRRSTVTLASLGLAIAASVGSVAPAHADEPGVFCTITSSGTLSAPTVVPYGNFFTLQWNTRADYCSAPVVYITGPGFGGSGEWLGLNGSRQIRAVPNGSSTTMTWTLTIFDLETDSQPNQQLAQVSVTVP